MYHPKEDYEISYEDTTEIDFSKPKTAEEVGRKLLKLNQLDNVEIENHYHTRTFPAPDGSDVNTVSEIYRIVATKSFFLFRWKICSLVEKGLNTIRLHQSRQNLQKFIRVIIKHGNFTIGVIKIDQHRINQELKSKSVILRNKGIKIF